MFWVKTITYLECCLLLPSLQVESRSLESQDDVDRRKTATKCKMVIAYQDLCCYSLLIGHPTALLLQNLQQSLCLWWAWLILALIFVFQLCKFKIYDNIKIQNLPKIFCWKTFKLLICSDRPHSTSFWYENFKQRSFIYNKSLPISPMKKYFSLLQNDAPLGQNKSLRTFIE